MKAHYATETEWLQDFHREQEHAARDRVSRPLDKPLIHSKPMPIARTSALTYSKPMPIRRT